MSNQVIEKPTIDDNSTIGSGRWALVAYNNATSTVEDVREAIMSATKCSYSEAHTKTMQIHHEGLAIIVTGSQETCEKGQGPLNRVGVKTIVCPEEEA
jgi:ATP-dependent Clp protease adapter protein ClpS